MQTLKNYFSFKVGVLTFVGVFMAASAVLALAPRKTNQILADSCQNAPTVSTLNPFSYTYQGFAYGTDCFDFPPLLAKNVSKGQSYPQNVS